MSAITKAVEAGRDCAENGNYPKGLSHFETALNLAKSPGPARVSQDENRDGGRGYKGGARAGPPAAGPLGRSVLAQRSPAAAANMAGKSGVKDGGKEADACKADKARSYQGPDQELTAMLRRYIVEGGVHVKWEDIAGLEQAKLVLNEALVLPMVTPDVVGIRRPAKSVLLYGPPGTGKTLLAKAAATEGQCTFFDICSVTLASKYRGKSERLVRVLLDMARAMAPSIIYVDEVDIANEASRRFMAELLVQVDGVNGGAGDKDKEGGKGGEEAQGPKHVFVLAATTRPWEIDEAVRRRLEKHVYIPLPGQPERKRVLEINLKNVDVDPRLDIDAVAVQLDGYSCDDVVNVCRDAALCGVRRIIHGKTPAEIMAMRKPLSTEPITSEDFAQAIRKIKPSVGPKDVKPHEEWKELYGTD